MMPLAIITPTRERWPFLREQSRAIRPQLAPDDVWLIGSDEGEPCHADINYEMAGIDVPAAQVILCRFDYRQRPPEGRGVVDRLANSLAAFAPPTHDLVEIDDHDPIAPDGLSEIRHAFAAAYDFVFGWHQQRVKIDPDGPFEAWPTIERDYTPGAFARHEFDAIGLRAVRRSLWDKLGGRDSSKFPFGHYDLAVRAEALGARIVCLQKPLCTVTIEPENSICGLFHQLQAAGERSGSSGSST